jgi:hypothetical protein
MLSEYAYWTARDMVNRVSWLLAYVHVIRTGLKNKQVSKTLGLEDHVIQYDNSVGL